MKTVRREALRLADYVRSGSCVLVGHSTAEPATLLEAFVAQRTDYAGARLFLHAAFSDIVRPEHADCLRLYGLGAVGTLARLARSGVLDIIPVHLSEFARSIKRGAFTIDVMMISVSPPSPEGRYSFGLVGDYLWEASRRAGVVIAEMNVQMPFTEGGPFLTSDDIDVLVPTDRALIELLPGRTGHIERAIAANAATYLDDGAVLQFGIGAVPDAFAATLGSFRDLGIHSGVIPTAVMHLIESGVVTNARKAIDKGITVTGAVWGTRALYDFVDGNPVLHVRSSTYTHAADTIAKLAGFVSLNSAIEIDLSGQANLEMAGGHYIGAIGGAVDFVRGASLSMGGRSILALPSTAAKGTASRIVFDLNGPVTIARSDIDTVVTEYGRAELRGQPLRERARRLISIAHPDFREALERRVAANARGQSKLT
jgi:acyl-CoA hydrolase